MSEDNKILVHRFIEEIWHKGYLEAIPEFLAPHYVRHTTQTESGGRDFHGLESPTQKIAMVRQAFPDIHFTLEDTMVDGEKVVVRWTCRGTHQGVFRGIAPTGKRIAYTGINIYRVVAGKIVERWAETDGVSLLQQLGAIRPHGEVSPEVHERSMGERG